MKHSWQRNYISIFYDNVLVLEIISRSVHIGLCKFYYYLFITHISSKHNKNTHVDIHNTVKILKLHKIQGYKKPTLRCQQMSPRHSV